MQSIGRRGLPQALAKNGLLPDPGTGWAARNAGLGASSEHRHRKGEAKRMSGPDKKEKPLSKNEMAAPKKKAVQKKKHGFWW
ncbi:hypothetical protein [Methylacidimicrobium sp. B4]|uniref:hypothetical protein n=1 Tax=Methylacidimicrobium sp. B4 TaxID=2796139 RepID=UPI001A903B50|nr:hypothetical protein [Methylacidimicrobium sp. B4]QSR85207.1 hypothetical protein MacB4_02790 [Methylacidimicrobium sp. B4]